MQATMARTAFAGLHGPRALAWGRGVAHVRLLSGGPDGYWFSAQRRDVLLTALLPSPEWLLSSPACRRR